MEIKLTDNNNSDNHLFFLPRQRGQGSDGVVEIEVTPEGISHIEIPAKELLEAAKAAAALAKA